MRNDNLRNKLNEMPQDFDQEALWSKIDLPKKKKRRFFWLFTSGFLMLSAFGIWYVSSTIMDQDSNVSIPTESILADSKTSSKSLDQINSKQNVAVSESLTEHTDWGLNTKEDQSDQSINETPIKNRQLVHDSEGSSQINYTNSKMASVQKNPPSISVNVALKTVPESNYSNRSFLSSNKKLETSITESRPPANQKSILTIPYLSYPSILLKSKSTFYKFDDMTLAMSFNPIEDKKDNGTTKGWEISAIGLYGIPNHDFGSSTNASKRAHEEEGLESISTGLLGQYTVGRFQWSSGLLYNSHHTRVSNSIEDYAVLNSISTLKQSTTTSTYNLYNSYQHVDLNFGFGYRVLSLSNWQFVPSLWVGYSFNLKANGELFDEEDNLRSLNKLSEYADYSKWNTSLHLKIERRINESFSIGLHSYLNNRRRLAGFVAYDHTVLTYGFGLSLNRKFQL